MPPSTHSPLSGAVRPLLVATLLSAELAVPHPAAQGGEEETAAAMDERPSIAAVRVDEPPVVDGALDEPSWTAAPAGGGLIQYEPATAEEMTERTEFRFLYDDDSLYVGVRCFDSEPDKIIARVMARDDELFNDDSIFMVFDTFLDRRNGYVFMVNPNGARYDALISENTHINRDWDAIWTAAARIDGEGWSAELAIPFKSLAFDPDSDTWGFNISRSIKRKSERGRWSGARPEIRTYNVGEAGTLTGLRGIRQGLGLDLVPYALGRFTSDRVDREDDLESDFGIDARYRITPNLTAIVSYNTDFAETEVDDRQVNLTRFSLFFPEKRDFFLEDSGIFRFGGLDTFNSRRANITGSRPPDFLPFFSRRIGLDLDGEPVPIDFAAKLTGRVGPYNVGVLDALLDDHDDLDAKNAFVARISRNVLEQSSVGVLATVGDPNSDRQNVVGGADAGYRTTTIFGDQILEANAFALGSHTEGDGGVEAAWGASVSMPNDLYRASLDFFEIGDEFNAALGFVPRPGIRSYGGSASYQPRPRSNDLIRQLYFIYRNRLVTDRSDTLESAIHSFTPLYILFESSDEFYIRTEYELDAPDEDFEISEGVTISEGSYEWLSHVVGVDTASKRPVRLTFEYRFGEFYDGDRQRYTAGLFLLPWRRLGATLSYDLNQARLPEGDFDTRLASVRMQWNFTPDLTWFHLVQYDSVTDSVGYNSRIRWEFRPGSTIYLVLNQGVDRDHGSLDLERSEVTAKVGVTLRF